MAFIWMSEVRREHFHGREALVFYVDLNHFVSGW